MFGVDPMLVDPAGGDFRLQPGSLATGYGCRTIASPLLMRPPRLGPARLRGGVIDVSGKIDTDTTWDAELVRVQDDVAIDPGVVLTIAAGVRIEFQGYYQLSVHGTIVSVGTPDLPIIFTTSEPGLFAPDASRTGCWHGIRFPETKATNSPSRLEHCIIEYSKALDGDAGDYAFGGGAISIVDYADCTIANCIIRHNVAEYGGAVFLYRHANVTLRGNLLVDNHALYNASAVYCGYSQPRLIQNTIVRNPIHNDENPYIGTSAIVNFIAKPTLKGNIVRDNDPDVLYLHDEIVNSKTWYASYNNIAGYEGGLANIDVPPQFVDPDGMDDMPGNDDDDFRLRIESPGVDMGDPLVSPGWTNDLFGADRVLDGDGDGVAVIDIGAYEAGDCDADGLSDRAELMGVGGLFESLSGPDRSLYANVPACAHVYGPVFDRDEDGDVDLVDVATLQAVGWP